MRTTLTLDPDVVRLIEEQTHRQRKTFKEVVNDALRRGLSPGGGRRRDKPPYRVRVHSARLKAGLDKTGFNRLSDELEDAALLVRR